MKDNSKEIAETIIQQMGGIGKLKSMIGAENFSYNTNGELTFKFKMCKKSNCVQIFYDQGTDLYNITFLKINLEKLEIKKIEKFEQIYCDQLIEIFEQFTGLRLSLF